MTRLRQRSMLFFKGVAMGAADVVPGVSGGTVALITGIYDELLASLKSFDVAAAKLLLSGQFAALWKHVNGAFLLTLFSGVLLSILSLARIISYFLQQFPELVWSFFLGLILVSALYIARGIARWNVVTVFMLATGIGLAWLLTVAYPLQLQPTLMTLFFAGALAICAMILPGISGSFVLLLLGLYTPVLAAIKSFDLPLLLTVATGCALGLLCFSKLLYWLLHHYHEVTMAFLCGLMLGSLNKVWPWKEALSYRQNSAGDLVPLLERNISPQAYEAVAGQSAYLGGSLFMMLLGIVLVLIVAAVSTGSE